MGKENLNNSFLAKNIILYGSRPKPKGISKALTWLHINTYCLLFSIFLEKISSYLTDVDHRIHLAQNRDNLPVKVFSLSNQPNKIIGVEQITIDKKVLKNIQIILKTA